MANARCVLPVPDGDGASPSPANVKGNIASIRKNVVVIRTHKSKALISVRVPQDEPIYTAFGGYGNVSELRKGQRASIWFADCKRGKEAIPVSAYFEIFSKAPSDRQ